MKMKLTNCKLSKKTQLKLLEFFVLGVTARAAADLLEIHHNSAALFFTKVRKIIAYYLEIEALELFDGEIELDESYFGGTRKGKRGRGAADKMIVFGLLKRNGKVYTVIVSDTKSSTLMPVITKKITPDGIVYTDQWRSYNALDVGFCHHRINHSTHFANGKNHINGIENFGIKRKEYCENIMAFRRNHFLVFERMRV
jgi:transposase